MLGNEGAVLARWDYWECRVASCGPIDRLGLWRSSAQRTPKVVSVVSLERPCCFRPSQRKRGKETGVAERVGQGRAGGCRGSEGCAGSRNNFAVNITRRVTERTKQEQLEARQRLGKSGSLRAGWAPKRGARCLDDIFLIGPGVGRWDAWMREWRGIRGFIFVGPVSLSACEPVTCHLSMAWQLAAPDQARPSSTKTGAGLGHDRPLSTFASSPQSGAFPSRDDPEDHFSALWVPIIALLWVCCFLVATTVPFPKQSRVVVLSLSLSAQSRDGET